jgi:formylglycine-generating enzyme required for sulfatase activity
VAADLAFDRLPILADALEDAGCDNLALLNHLRADGPHRVECWALRRLLRTTLLLPGGVPITFAYCPPGRFMMGSLDPSAHENERPVHQVTLSNGFHAGIYPVTQEQWRVVMGTEPSEFEGRDRPVEQVSWQEAQAFCRRATETTGHGIRLPTEAEWEYACRAGTVTIFHYGDQASGHHMNHYAHFPWGDFAPLPNPNETTSVGSYPPNPWGLFDCHGNVWEWCADWYSGSFYSSGSACDPLCTDANITRRRVCRGGAWSSRPEGCRASTRYVLSPHGKEQDVGFRVVFTA